MRGRPLASDDPNYYSSHVPHWASRNEWSEFDPKPSNTQATGSVTVRGPTQLLAEAYARQLIDEFVGDRKYILTLDSYASTTDLYADRGSWVTEARWECI